VHRSENRYARLLRITEHPFLQHQGFPRIVPCTGAKMEQAVAPNAWADACG
jgi:hypothetical protein